MQKKQNNSKFLIFLCLLAASAFSESATQEWTFDFEQPAARMEDVSADWYQNKAANFKPLGTVELVDDPFANRKKAVSIRSKEKSTAVVSRPSIPAQAGDTFQVTVLFRSVNGQDKARIGLYGFNDKGAMEDYQASEFKALNNEWDMQQTCFEIRKESVTQVAFFLSAVANQNVNYSFLRVKKLSPEEAFLIAPKNSVGLWHQRTQGTNLALGKTVTFIPERNYDLTSAGGTDHTDLTDGKLAKGGGGLWFEKEAVAWFRALNGVAIMVDLGEVKAVQKGVIRICGGNLKGVSFPTILEAWVSKDGKDFYQAAGMKKVAESERGIINWKELYYLPESNDKPVYYVYPFELPIGAEARYVAIRAPVYTALMMISDEFAVIEASEEETGSLSWNAVYQQQAEPLFHGSVRLRPRMDTLYIAANMKLPNWLRLDCQLPETTGEFRYEIEIPENILFIPEESWPQFTRTLVDTKHANGRVTYVFKPKTDFSTFLRTVRRYQLGPFFFVTNGKVTDKEQRYALFTTFYNDREEMSQRIPIEYLDIPEVPPLKRLHVSLAWTENRHQISYPDFLENQKKLGFTEISLFALSKDAVKMQELARQAVEQGYRIRLQMSPTAHLNSLYRDVTEYKCGSCQDICSVCPAYRGKYYHDMLQLIENAVRDYPGDAITFDEETWGTAHLNKSVNCPYCNELKKQKNMEWGQYFEWAMADFLAGFKEAVIRGAAAGNKKVPTIGYYDLTPHEIRQCTFGKLHFLGYPYLYPKYSDEIQDSYYGRDTKIAHERARAIFKVIGDPALVNTWITGGSGAHCETAYSKRTGQHLIETLMNGAGGIQYFMYPSFESPLDYYYHALAMQQIAPFEDILMDGILDEELAGSDTSILYTARTLGTKTLLLIGNYDSPQIKTTKIQVGDVKRVTDQITGKQITAQNGKIVVALAADSYALILIEK